MNVRFNRQEMAQAMSAICGVTPVRTPKPVLRCVRMEARKDVLLLSATDLELTLRYTVTQVEVAQVGETLVVADTFARIVRECADELLNIELVKNELHIRGAGSHFQLLTQPVEDFPPVPAVEGQPDFTIDQQVLRSLIERTVFACARDSSRYAINGVLCEVADEQLTLVATDGRRLAFARAKLVSVKTESIPQVIVPARALLLFERLPVDGDAQVTVRVAPNQLLLEVGQVLLGTALVEGHFPKYSEVIPRERPKVVKLKTAEFRSALKQAALLTNEESKGVRFSFTDGALTLSSRVPEQGEATISFPVCYTGEALEIGFNPVFLLDVLRIVDMEEITFTFEAPNRPGVARFNDDFIYVVMPVELTSAKASA